VQKQQPNPTQSIAKASKQIMHQIQQPSCQQCRLRDPSIEGSRQNRQQLQSRLKRSDEICGFKSDNLLEQCKQQVCKDKGQKSVDQELELKSQKQGKIC